MFDDTLLHLVYLVFRLFHFFVDISQGFFKLLAFELALVVLLHLLLQVVGNLSQLLVFLLQTVLQFLDHLASSAALLKTSEQLIDSSLFVVRLCLIISIFLLNCLHFFLKRVDLDGHLFDSGL